jgi:hypothetical protein
MKDLGTLGGDNSEAIWINESGDIAGSADLPGPLRSVPELRLQNSCYRFKVPGRLTPPKKYFKKRSGPDIRDNLSSEAQSRIVPRFP